MLLQNVEELPWDYLTNTGLYDAIHVEACTCEDVVLLKIHKNSVGEIVVVASEILPAFISGMSDMPVPQTTISCYAKSYVFKHTAPDAVYERCSFSMFMTSYGKGSTGILTCKLAEGLSFNLMSIPKNCLSDIIKAICAYMETHKNETETKG